jgi:hypothetical protein
MLGDWNLVVTGEIVRVDREDVDKSGRNPKYFIQLTVRPRALEAPPEAQLGAQLVFRIRDRELAAMLPREPAVGEVYRLTGAASGPRPELFYLKAIAPA